jgi:hypothetical protein
MTNDQSADHRRRIRLLLLLVFCEMKLNESKKIPDGRSCGTRGGSFHTLWAAATGLERLTEREREKLSRRFFSVCPVL